MEKIEEKGDAMYNSEKYSELEDRGLHPYDIGFQFGYTTRNDEVTERIQHEIMTITELSKYTSNEALIRQYNYTIKTLTTLLQTIKKDEK